MKNLSLGLMISLGVLLATTLNTQQPLTPITFSDKEDTDTITPPRVDTLSEFISFIDRLAQSESNYNPEVINRFGYVGWFQFGKLAVMDINRKTKDSVLKRITTNYNWPNQDLRKKRYHKIFDEEHQIYMLWELMKINHTYLEKKDAFKYVGRCINDVEITYSGLLAASHLVGPRNVMKFLESSGKIVPLDGNKVTCVKYLQLFSNYKINSFHSWKSQNLKNVVGEGLKKLKLKFNNLKLKNENEEDHPNQNNPKSNPKISL